MYKKNFLALTKSCGIIPLVNRMDRSNIEKIAKTPEDRVLLAKLWDKIQAGIRRNVAANTGFLSLREMDMARYLFGQAAGLHTFGGYPDAQRQMLIYLPEYMDADHLTSAESPVVCLRAVFYDKDTPTHRDFLGALMGAGIARETVGDISVGNSFCDFFVTAEIASYILQNLESAGKTKIRLSQIPLTEVEIREPDTVQIHDTVASVRLDSIISTGFRISRGQACQYITGGKASIDGLPCEKTDKPVLEGSSISVRGLGKIKLTAIRTETKKGRIRIVIDRYV